MDWGEASEPFDQILEGISGRDLSTENEAQTRYDLIDRIIREVLGWRHGQVHVEEATDDSSRLGYVDYILRSGDNVIVVEAKRYGLAFPTPTRRRNLKLRGTVLTVGPIGAAIEQARTYAVSKGADVAVVTNGACWCAFVPGDPRDEADGTLFFPVDRPADGEALFGLLALGNVERGSLSSLTATAGQFENRLLGSVRDADDRVDRNTIADHILPALEQALYADAILADAQQLDANFVKTEARTRFDSQLNVHLGDPKPSAIAPASRVRRDKRGGHLEGVVGSSQPSHAPPVTLLIGAVGAGKSTYLKHFELVSSKAALKERRVHWIYVDFERMGPGQEPRAFIYDSVRTYLLGDHPDNPTDWKSAVEPAYDVEISGLARGPLAMLFTADRPAFNAQVAEHVQRDFAAVEPYVDKVLTYLASRQLCILVLDNVDLYEDAPLETRVLGEGLALSKRTNAHVIISIRDRTFIQHKSDSALDAYELRKLWLDPPPFREVLSRRLTYARAVLKDREARIALPNGMSLAVPDLGAFFEIVQRSVLSGPAGDFVEAMADHNIRKGLRLISSFLTSGHIQADRALKTYIEGSTDYFFPFHEVFKGTMLGQWRYFKEGRAECINLFDARLGSRQLQLLRLWVIRYLVQKAQHENGTEVPVAELFNLFGRVGCSEVQMLEVLRVLDRERLIHELGGREPSATSVVAITRSAAFYVRFLAGRFAYAEDVMMDTPIYDDDAWHQMAGLTVAVERERSVAERMRVRAQRIAHFMQYLDDVERSALSPDLGLDGLRAIPEIRSLVVRESDVAVSRSARYFSSR